MKRNYEFINVGECGDGVQYIGLNRPDKRSALDNFRRAALPEALQDDLAARIKQRLA